MFRPCAWVQPVQVVQCIFSVSLLRIGPIYQLYYPFSIVPT